MKLFKYGNKISRQENRSANADIVIIANMFFEAIAKKNPTTKHSNKIVAVDILIKKEIFLCFAFINQPIR